MITEKKCVLRNDWLTSYHIIYLQLSASFDRCITCYRKLAFYEYLEVKNIGFIPIFLSISLCLSISHPFPSLSLSFFERWTCLWSCTCDKVSAWCFPFTTTLLCSSELEAVTQERRNNTQESDIKSLWTKYCLTSPCWILHWEISG